MPSPGRVLLLTSALLALACGKGKNDEKRGAALASASAAPAQVSASAPAPAPLPPAAPVTCRALGVAGDAKVGDTVITSGSTLDGSDWVSLAKDAKVSLKHSQTGRELTFLGPARFRPCRRGREQVLLVSGTVLAAAGMGSRPGGEVMIATPLALVHYADAELTLTLDDRQLSVAVRAGNVEVEPLPPPKKPLKSPLRAKDRLTLPLGKPDAVRLMADCKAAAEQAEQSARRVSDKSASEPLGERAQAHVRARKSARAVCSVAAAATGLVADPGERAGLWAEATQWEGLWESIPRRSRAQAPEK